MRGKNNIDWSVQHEKHIKAEDNRMQSIPIREQFFLVDTMEGTRSYNGFVIHSSRRCAAYGYAIFRSLPSRYIFRFIDVFRILHPCIDVNAKPRVRTVTNVPTAADASTHAAVDGDIDAQYHSDIPKIWGTLWFHAYSNPNTVHITILRWWLIVATGG
ncbi:hypothetical protein PVK06_029966 [Gossypium arboreum]|uniref:Uncharacterized protein n=1 Tax=Gossypium arboreum TaxID=29729 RepID=A0ABR0NM05_GOSAR|nr:hypothetical protein PVK06_029966 [Gossypium arboreum]